MVSIGHSRQGQTLAKATFFSVDLRVKVYKARATMKGTHNQTSLNEDLTKRREWLDFVVRLLFKGKYIKKNCTLPGATYL